MDMKYLHPADQLTMMMDRIYHYGMTTTSGGNLSILDENGDVWITPSGVDKGNLTRKDMMCIKKDGSIEGLHKPSSEYPFHLKVYEVRPDLKAVLHAHPPALVAFSIVRKVPDTKLFSNAFAGIGKISIAEYGLPGSEQLGTRVAKEFAEGADIAVLENHGVVVGSTSLFEAFKMFENLDFCARLQIDASVIGTPKSLKAEDIGLKYTKAHFEMGEYTPDFIGSDEKEARFEMCDLIHRAYKQKLINAAQGSFSRRMGDDFFLITPTGMDRKYLEVQDIVSVKDGLREAGKVPSRSVLIHQEIYRKHPEIRSIIIAHPPSLMAFAVTEEMLDSRSIPESYILMREIPKLEYSPFYQNPQETVDSFKANTPIVMIKNDCVIVTGNNLLNAFDRLEVAEYSARALVFSKNLGQMIAINDEQINDLKVAFKLSD